MQRIDRRTYLTLLAGGTILLAGCAGDEDADSDEASSRNDETGTDSRQRSERDESEDEDEQSDPSTADEMPADLAVGDPIDIGSLTLVVADFERANDVPVGENDEVLEADEGEAFGVVDLAVQQTGDEAVIAVDDVVTVDLGADEDGREYDRVAVTADETAEVIDPVTSRLAPGEVARGDLVFEIDDADGFVLDLESGGETITVDLETESESSTVLEQDLSNVHSFGQGIEMAGMTVTVATLEQGNNLGGFMQSDEGHETVAVGIDIENASGRERTLAPKQVHLKDELGRSYADAPGVLRALEGVDGHVLQDGDEHEGTVIYQVEDGLGELYWAFDFSEWGENRRAFWQLR
ncbi:DUF4352 domain-containing protein [Natrialbaceae archaeon A-arb3/5]